MNENFDAELIQAFKDSLTETTDLNVETQSCNGDDESSVANRNLYSTAKPVGQRVSGDQGTIESLQIVQLKQSQYLQQNDMLAQKAALHGKSRPFEAFLYMLFLSELIWEGALCSNPIGMVHSQTEGRPWEWLPVFVRIFKFTQNASSCICIFNSRADQSKVFLKHYQVPSDVNVCSSNHLQPYTVLRVRFGKWRKPTRVQYTVECDVMDARGHARPLPHFREIGLQASYCSCPRL
jgi:hypothetical protein